MKDSHGLSRRRTFTPRRQSGALLMISMVLVALLGTGAAFIIFPQSNLDVASDRKTLDALSFARDALIAYAVTRGGPTGTARPGEFPCPDMDNDGRAEASCATDALGRLPWITLGIPEPKDSAGESLWYALALPFRNWASNPNAINSDMLGNLTVRLAGSSTPLTTQAAAVLFAPGERLTTQDRSTQIQAFCAATGTTTSARLCASNYLDAYEGINNAAANGPFISVTGKQPQGFNDRVLYIRTADFVPTVEQRVAAELADLVELYRKNSTCNCYPWAADWAALNGAAVTGINRGAFPTTALPLNWGAGGTPTLPLWVGANNWHQVIFYSAGKEQLEEAGSLCKTCSSSANLTFTRPSGAVAVSAILLTPGTPRTGVSRPSFTLSDYFEDPQNNHAGVACPSSGTAPAACDSYVQPTATTIDRDRAITMTSSPVTCSEAAASLAHIARTTTCGGPGNTVIPSCTAAVAQLSACAKCKSAAATLTKPPCYNVSNKPTAPKQCVSALAQLDVCT